MKKRSFLLPFSALFLLALPLTADTVIEEIVVRVNNDIITRSEYQRSREQLRSELREKFNSAEADAKFTDKARDTLRDLIDQDLLVQKGKDLGINADTEVIKRLDEMRKQMNLATMEDLEKAAQQQGISFEDFKQNLRNQIVTQQVIAKEVGSKMQITPEEIQTYYDSHKQELERPEEVRLSEILIPTTPKAAGESEQAADQKDAIPPTPEQLAAAEKKANELLQSIRKGTKFDEVAKKSSEGPTAAQGGDLGYFKRGMLAKELEDKTFAMKPGDISDVIRTKQGFIVLKVTERQQAGLPPLKDVQEDIQQAIYLEKLQPELRTYLTRLREDAYIDIKKGYVDTGASPNETKPVYTATSSQAPEKKKKKKKLLIF